MLATPDQQISLTDPDSRSMATSGRGSGVVGYNAGFSISSAGPNVGKGARGCVKTAVGLESFGGDRFGSCVEALC